MTLKTLLLTAALTISALSVPALAQANAPVTVPALPPSTPAPGPAAEPGTPEPATPEPTAPDVPAVPEAPTEPAVPTPVLLLTAAPGTYAEYVQTNRTSIKLLTYHLEAQPGKTVKAAALAAADQKLQAQRPQIEKAFGQALNNQTSKLFMKVLPPKNGNAALLYTSVLNLPDPLNPKKQTVANVGVTLTFDPEGKLTDASVATQNPTLQKLYKALDLASLIKSVQSSGTTSYYGLPLVKGEPTVTTSAVPMQSLIQGLVGTLTGPNSAQGSSTQGNSAQGSAQAGPLTMQTTTSYTGTDAQGNLTFSQTYTAEPWNVSLTVRDLKMDVKVLGLTGNASSVLRPDGFPRSSQVQQDMTMQMQLNLPGEPYRLVMQLQYGTRLNVALKNPPQP